MVFGELEKRTPPKVHLVEKKRTLAEWHRVFNHVGKGRILEMAKSPAMAPGFTLGNIADPDSQIHCSACVQAKSHTLPYPVSQNRASRPFELLHMGLAGPIIESTRRHRYCLVIVDDFSRFTWALFLKDKRSARKAFSIWHKRMIVQYGTPFKRIRTDRGGEFLNDRFRTKIIERMGIVHETTVPYAHQQNGVAERANRTIKEAARAILIDANSDRQQPLGLRRSISSALQ